ncbi:MAG TPA: CusA/CzcA family heavy metal efflux RND transporter [Vicinamibacterales bacterium]|nr:CusA/CzcA family heavy metal efflux RND transporter [Vicinamibacterales bacterium]
MIDKLIAFSARNGFIVILLIAAIVGGGYWAIRNTPIDAIPDLSDVQVIVTANWEGRSPTLVEDQVTYPIVTALISAPNVKVVRGFSYFDVSFIYVIFQDGTDLYWARSRVLEYLNGLQGRLPAGVTPVLGPDATGVGWGFSYALVDKSGKYDLSRLRTLNDWYVQYWLRSVPGVAEVAPVGGFVKQYQIQVDPNALLAYNMPIDMVAAAVRKSNNDVGGRVVEWTGREYMVRGRGYIKSIDDIAQISLGAKPDGTPILVRDVARVQLGPDMRRGVAELNGEGDAAGGIVVIRYGVDTYGVIESIKKAVKEKIQPALPEGVELVTTYDRSDLIERSIDTLKEKLIEESIIVSLVCVVFLWHMRSALVAILTLPLSILLSFLTMKYIGLGSNIMSLGGIAIAIGAMIDAAIIMIENAHKHIEYADGTTSRTDVLVAAAQEVGRPLFFSLLIITVSFLPIFTLEAQEGRLFRPLAFTKTFAMGFAALMSVLVVPYLMVLFVRGRIAPEEKNPINRFLIWVYHPCVRFVLRHRALTLMAALALLASTVPVYMKLGSEFMPPLYEGTFLYMPLTLPGASVQTAQDVLAAQDRLIKRIPEVSSVFGKAGRALSATDPAPLEMIETVINLKPESEWRPGMTPAKLEAELDRLVRVPGVANAWTMPIKARTDMLSTGIRTPVGVKVFGKDLDEISQVAADVESALRMVPGTRNVFAERVTGGYYVDFDVKRDQIARYGLTVQDVEMTIESAIGGANVTTTVEGRERFPVNIRYQRDYRSNIEGLRRVLIATPSGLQVPLEQVARISLSTGPTVIRTEQAQLLGYVYVDVADRDIGSYVADAKQQVAQLVKLPEGAYLEWSGQYEYMLRAQDRLKVVIPVTLLIVIMLLYFSTRNVTKIAIVLLAVPFSLIGAFWLIYLLGYNMSVAVWVGIIALAGVDAETGVVMLLYLDHAYEKHVKAGRMRSLADLQEAVQDGAVRRIRPKMMTVMAILLGLLPIMWSHGAGSDVMKRIAAPMVGGVITSFALELLIYPVIFTIWKSRGEMRPTLAQALRNRGTA